MKTLLDLDDQLVSFQKALSILKRREEREGGEIEKERVKQCLRLQLFILDNRRCLLLGNSSWTQCILCILRPPVLLYFSLLALLAFHDSISGCSFLWKLFGGSAFPKEKSWSEAIVDTLRSLDELYLESHLTNDHSRAQFIIWQGPTCIVYL